MNKAKTKIDSKKSERILITTSYYWVRYVMIFFMFIFGLTLLGNPTSWVLAVLFLISMGLYFFY